jgi:hypothetical protein
MRGHTDFDASKIRTVMKDDYMKRFESAMDFLGVVDPNIVFPTTPTPTNATSNGTGNMTNVTTTTLPPTTTTTVAMIANTTTGGPTPPDFKDWTFELSTAPMDTGTSPGTYHLKDYKCPITPDIPVTGVDLTERRWSRISNRMSSIMMSFGIGPTISNDTCYECLNVTAALEGVDNVVEQPPYLPPGMWSEAKCLDLSCGNCLDENIGKKYGCEVCKLTTLDIEEFVCVSHATCGDLTFSRFRLDKAEVSDTCGEAYDLGFKDVIKE